MFRLLLVGMGNAKFAEIVKALRAHKSVALDHADTGGGALSDLTEKTADLVVVGEKLADMSGLALAAKLVVLNPMINCALVSSLDRADFHEASEGLGILAQLSPEPDAFEAVSLVKKLSVITGRKLNQV